MVEALEVAENQLTERLARIDNNSVTLSDLYFNPDAESMEVPLELKNRIEAERSKLKNQQNIEVPEEILQAQQQLYEDIKEFFGVDELPQTEIATGVHLGVPAEYLEDEEKYEQYQEFMGEQMRALMKLYEEHGLREPANSRMQEDASTSDDVAGDRCFWCKG